MFSSRNASAREALRNDTELLEAPYVQDRSDGAEDSEVSQRSAFFARQLRWEDLDSDTDWTGGCFLSAYMRMNGRLIERAQHIQNEGRAGRDATAAASGQAEVTIRESLALLRREVFSLCPTRILITGIGISFVLTVFTFCVPYWQGKLLDSAVEAHHEYRTTGHVDIAAAIVPSLTVVASLIMASYICEIFVGILFAICGHTTVTRLRKKLFRNLVMQEIAFYDAHVSGELSSRLINDSASLSSLTQFTTQTLLGAIVKFVGSLIAMFGTHPMLALIATVVTPINTLLVRKTGSVVGYYGIVQNNAMAKANAVAIEVLGSIRTVQSNVGEDGEADRFMDRMNHYLRIIKFTVYIETILRFTSYGLSKARSVVVLGIAMHQVIVGELSVGGFTAFTQYVSLYEDGFKSLADIWINFRQTVTATGKFVQLLLRQPDISTSGGRRPASCNGAVTLEKVFFAYKTRTDYPVLNEISLTAVPGDVIALVGESGAGKTTVVRLLERYYDPLGGRILLDGEDYTRLNLKWLRSQVGFVEQEPVLFDRPIHENIAYGAASTRSMEEVMQAARLANAHDFIQNLGKGYDTHPGEKAVRISGGQKQRVAIARAVIRSPKVLLLDEATSALDSENEDIVQRALDNLMTGKTTFIVAHRLSTVVRATKILVLDKGRVLEQGTHEELVADEKTKYSSFMRHQLVGPLLS